MMINFLILFFLFMAGAKAAYAYLDPGTGSFIFQLAVGAILGGLFTLKIYFKKIKLFLVRIFSKKTKNNGN